MQYYSASARGFFDSDVQTDFPADIVEVSDAERDALFAAQATGQVIVPDADGRPVAVENAVDAKVLAQLQIDAIERDTMTNRGARELHIQLLRREGQAMGLANDAAIAAKVPYFAKLIAIDTQIRALRAQL